MIKLPFDKISNTELIGAEELGLTLAIGEDGSCTLCGKPTKAGDFTLKLRFNTIEGEEASELSIPIAFNPNPRDLWKNIPTDPNIQYYKEDSETAYVKVEGESDNYSKKDIVAASQRGRSHAQEGKARDDHFALYHCPDSDWYIIEVADGAGSAKYSRRGSEIACTTAVEHCIEKLLNNPDFESAIAEFEADKENATKRSTLTKHVIDKQSLYMWHANRFITPNERTKTEDKKPVGDFHFHNGKWILINRRLQDMWDVTEQPKKQIKVGEYVELTEGRKILLSPEDGGRLIVVQVVNS